MKGEVKGGLILDFLIYEAEKLYFRSSGGVVKGFIFGLLNNSIFSEEPST